LLNLASYLDFQKLLDVTETSVERIDIPWLVGIMKTVHSCDQSLFQFALTVVRGSFLSQASFKETLKTLSGRARGCFAKQVEAGPLECLGLPILSLTEF